VKFEMERGRGNIYILESISEIGFKWKNHKHGDGMKFANSFVTAVLICY
jgi:hypothetical protein